MRLLQDTLIFGSFFILMVAVLTSVLNKDHPATTIQAQERRAIVEKRLFYIGATMLIGAIILGRV